MRSLLASRWLQVAVLFFAGCVMLGAGDPATSMDRIGHQLVCQCGCGQILLECNHVGCPVSGPMIEELRTQIASGLPASGVLNWFSNKYGPIVLAAPIRGGFDRVAWVVPFAVLALGIGAVFLLMRVWHTRRRAESLPASAGRQLDDATRERIRRDTHFEV